MGHIKTALFSGILGGIISTVIVAGASTSETDTGKHITEQDLSQFDLSTHLPATGAMGQVFSPGLSSAEESLGIGYWDDLKNKTDLLEGSAFLPVLLPVIMNNREALELTEAQVQHFLDWREKKLATTLELMSQIVKKRIDFKSASLDPNTSTEELLALQGEIFELHREALKLKLDCRDHLVETFNDEQWENFSFILSDHPKLASFIN